MKKHLYALLIPLLMTSCAHQILPPTENYAYFNMANHWIQIRTEPYENLMPGSSSEHYIIPIRFSLQNDEVGKEWPRQLLITKVDISGVPAEYTQVNKLDHQEWMNKEKGGNTLRVPKEHIPYHVFHMWIHFKDDKGKRYKVYFHNLGIGGVY
jgi:hypothetical protein